MALNHLTIEEMVDATQDWVAPGTPVRTAFEHQPVLAALIPTIERAHMGLLSGQRAILVHNINRLTRLRMRVDDRHDDQARGIHAVLEGYIHLARASSDDQRVRELTQIRDFLFPEGLTIINMSYRQEAGQANLLTSRFTADVESRLATIPMPGGTLLDSVRAWLATGAELGKLEDEYADMHVPSKRALLRKARSSWMKMIQAVRTVAALEAAGDPDIEAALNRIVVIEKAAALRLREQGLLDGDGEGESEGDAGGESDAGGAGDATGDGDASGDGESGESGDGTADGAPDSSAYAELAG